RSIIEGIYLFKNDREASIRALTKYLRIDDRETLEEVYRIYYEIYQPIPYPSASAIQTQLTWMAERDPRAKNAKPEQFIAGSFCARLKRADSLPSCIRSSSNRPCYTFPAWPSAQHPCADGFVDLPQHQFVALG